MSRWPGLTALMAAGVVVGIALRVWILASSQGALDADEAVWGLMARHVLDGEFPVFFWGQAYGGTQQVYVTAAVFWIVGSSVLALKLVEIALWAVAALLVWRVGRRTLGEPRARLAAVVFWIWPAYFVWRSTRALGYYGAGLVLGLTIVLLALRLRERDSPSDLALLGLALGLGWWATPQIGILALPALAWLVWRRPRVVRSAWIVVPGAVAGALPWLVSNLRHDWYSFELAADETSKLDHAHNLFVATLPTALGLRAPFSLEWLVSPALGIVLLALALAAFVVLLVRRPSELELLLLTALVFPVLYVLSPYSWLNTEPRYLTLLAPVLALLIAASFGTARRAVAVLAALLALSIGGVALMVRDDLAASYTSGPTTVPADFGPLLRTLERNGLDRVYADYWLAHRITFESGERILAATTSERRFAARDGVVRPVDEGEGRYPAYNRAVDKSRNAAFVYVEGDPYARRGTRLYERQCYRRLQAGRFVVYAAPATSASPATAR